MNKHIRIAHSPDSDDAFMFYALAENRIDARGYRFEHVLADIETLNQEARKGTYEITALSIHAFAHLADRYVLLPHGASMGDNYGPLVVAPRGSTLTANCLKGRRIAIPGAWTSAYLALRLYEPEFTAVMTPFDEISQGVLDGDVDAGVIIHEGQLTYEDEGLVKVMDLGEWWHAETEGLPLPLGGNAIRRDLGEAAIGELSKLLREAIQFSLDHRQEALRHAMQYARGMDEARADQFVGMYVNELTLDYGARGRTAVELFLRRGADAGLVPRVEITFAAE